MACLDDKKCSQQEKIKIGAKRKLKKKKSHSITHCINTLLRLKKVFIPKYNI